MKQAVLKLPANAFRSLPSAYRSHYPRLSSSVLFLLMFVACSSLDPVDTVPVNTANEQISIAVADDENKAAAGNAKQLAATAPRPSTEEDYRQSVITLLETFDGILTASTIENELTALYQKIRPLLAEGRIQVAADRTELRNTLQRSQTYIDEEKRPVILLHASILDEVKDNPVSALSEFAGKLAFVHTFLQYGETIVELYQNPLEYYLSQMDALYLQTIFLRDFARPLYGEERIGHYENYLLQGLAVDDLSSISLFVWGIDRAIVYSMIGLSKQLGMDSVSVEGYMYEIIQLGIDIRDNMEQSRRLFAESGTDDGTDGDVARRSMYIAATSANTYRSLGSVIISAAIGNFLSETERITVNDQILEISQIHTLLDLLIGEVAEFRKNYQKNYLSSF